MNKTIVILLIVVGVMSAAHQSFKALADPPRDSNPRQPRGARIVVDGYFEITDSSDGVRDRRVEAYGYLDLNGQRSWTQNRKTAPSRSRALIRVTTQTFDVIYSDPSTWKLKITGYMRDYDKGSDDDAMWNSPIRTREIDLKRFADSNAMINEGQRYTFAGDRDSENADLKLRVTGVTIY